MIKTEIFVLSGQFLTKRDKALAKYAELVSNPYITIESRRLTASNDEENEDEDYDDDLYLTVTYSKYPNHEDILNKYKQVRLFCYDIYNEGDKRKYEYFKFIESDLIEVIFESKASERGDQYILVEYIDKQFITSSRSNTIKDPDGDVVVEFDTITGQYIVR